jgi:FtsZ-binding cell division protein ZapB
MKTSERYPLLTAIGYELMNLLEENRVLIEDNKYLDNKNEEYREYVNNQFKNSQEALGNMLKSLIDKDKIEN